MTQRGQDNQVSKWESHAIKAECAALKSDDTMSTLLAYNSKETKLVREPRRSGIIL